jgi:hypothetical protein
MEGALNEPIQTQDADSPAAGAFVNKTAPTQGRLPEPAVAWINRLRSRGQTHLLYPVSRLQRDFRSARRRSAR